MIRGEQIILPARNRYIVLTFLVAFCLQLIPLGVQTWRPDFLLLVLVFWAIQQPERIGIAWAFFFGVLMDVQSASLLGQHALAYSVVVFGVQAVRNRLMWYRSGMQQSVFLFQFFVLAQVVMFIVGYLSSRVVPPWEFWLAPIFHTLLWPLVRWILLRPQMRSFNQDAHRPL